MLTRQDIVLRVYWQYTERYRKYCSVTWKKCSTATDIRHVEKRQHLPKFFFKRTNVWPRQGTLSLLRETSISRLSINIGNNCDSKWSWSGNQKKLPHCAGDTTRASWLWRERWRWQVKGRTGTSLINGGDNIIEQERNKKRTDGRRAECK